MYENYPSTVIIPPFQFTNVSLVKVYALLQDINSSKAMGYDTIPAIANELDRPVFSLVDISLSPSCFPYEFKKSETSPLNKSHDNIEPQNDRPLSVLAYLSHIHQRILTIKRLCFSKIYRQHYCLHFVAVRLPLFIDRIDVKQKTVT